MHLTRNNFIAILEQMLKNIDEGALVRLHETCPERGPVVHCLVPWCHDGVSCEWDRILTAAVDMMFARTHSTYRFVECADRESTSLFRTMRGVVTTAIYLLRNYICTDVPLIIAMLVEIGEYHDSVRNFSHDPRLLRIEASWKEYRAEKRPILEAHLWIREMSPDVQALHVIGMIHWLRRHLNMPESVPAGTHDKCLQYAENQMTAVRDGIPHNLFRGISDLISEVRARFSPPPPPP